MDSPHPPFVGPAMTQPRQLQKWLDVNPQGGPLKRTQTFITIPTFEVVVNWLGFSEIVGEFHYEATHNFSLKNFTGPSDPNHTCCISYVNSDNTVVRYRLWTASSGEVIYSIIPEYEGQLIKKNFRVEIWSAGVDVSLSVVVAIYTSVRGNLDYRYGIDSALVTADNLCTGQQSSESSYTVPTLGIFGYDMSTAFRPGTSLMNWPSRFNGLTLTANPVVPAQDTGGNFPYICHQTNGLHRTAIPNLGSLRHMLFATSLYLNASGPIFTVTTNGLMGVILIQQEPTTDRITVSDDFFGTLLFSDDNMLGINVIIELIINNDDTLTVNICDMDGFVLNTANYPGYDHTALGYMTTFELGGGSSTVCIGFYGYPRVLTTQERNEILALLSHNAFPVIQDFMALPFEWGACAQPVLNV